MVSIELQAQLKDQNLSPENTLISKEEIDALFYAINLLPENQRIAYTLCNMNELTYVEISESMNLSLSAVESLIFRAKKNLKKTLTDTITH
jgi:RNA polymerase sigma factor (sigma-70 family)